MKKVISIVLILLFATNMLSCNNGNEDIIIKEELTLGDVSDVSVSDDGSFEKYIDDKMIGDK
ncbi:MAG: hypothetical protein IJS35_04665, partial [Firmicutes bacterium]|nr:hypothetical protein [Bacillota bacterium]